MALSIPSDLLISSEDCSPPPYAHPFKNSKSLLVVIPDRIDVEEESRLFDDLHESPDIPRWPSYIPPRSPVGHGTASVFSREIWLADSLGESIGFARDVKISGWTNVGDVLGGAYIVYDCVIRTKEGTVIHAHKRYSEFERLYRTLLHDSPLNRRQLIPPLPPKSPLSKYRPAFLDKRRRQLEHWLAAILLHPDMGGCEFVGKWVLN